MSDFQAIAMMCDYDRSAPVTAGSSPNASRDEIPRHHSADRRTAPGIGAARQPVAGNKAPAE
jgi:hypothetical protein